MNEIFYNIHQEIDKLAKDVVQLLKENSIIISTAESCTGGLLSAAITEVPGSSSVFNLGQCVYANNAKEKNLGVNSNTLKTFGAVSKETALEMARGAIKNGFGNLGLSTTGIAGPDGGTEEKPVGTVYIAAALEKSEIYRLLQITDFHIPIIDRRKYIRYTTVLEALKLARETIIKYNKDDIKWQ